jgi:hypothetical protein
VVFKHSGVAVAVFGVAGLLASCSSPAVLSSPTTHGPEGYRFSASFAKSPSVRTLQISDTEGQALYGTSVATRWIWSGGTTTVWVDALTKPVRPGRLPYLLRSYLPSGPSGRGLTKSGDPAMVGVVPGCIPTGQCSGFVGGLVVLDGQTIYDLTTSQGTSSAANAVLASFRIVH